MALIISLAHQKGGVGKTTLTLNLYNFFIQTGARCAIVDVDAQGSIHNLYNKLSDQKNWKELNLIPRNSFKSFKDLAKNTDYDVLFTDTPPYLSNLLPEIFDASDLILIPCKASPLDALAISGTIDLVKNAQRVNPYLKAGIVLTMTISGTDFNEQMRSGLKQHGIPVLQSEIGNRIAFVRSLLFAPSVESEHNNKAEMEIETLANEIATLLKK